MPGLFNPNAPQAAALPAQAAPQIDFSGNPANLGAAYQQSYNNALSLNTANYNNILTGYQQAAESQRSGHDRIAAGYTGAGQTLAGMLGQAAEGFDALGSRVQGALNGADLGRRDEIRDTYAASRGHAAQGLASRGLGNSTVVDSVQRGIGLDEAKAYNNLTSQMANLRAGYMSDIGQAGLQFRGNAANSVYGATAQGLGYQGQANREQTALAQDRLNFLNSTSSPYPEVGPYAQLAQMYGANQQSAADRSLVMQGIDRLDQLSRTRPGNPPVAGPQYIPSGGGFPAPQSFGPTTAPFAPASGTFSPPAGYTVGNPAPAFNANLGNVPYGAIQAAANGAAGGVNALGAYGDQNAEEGTGFWGNLAANAYDYGLYGE